MEGKKVILVNSSQGGTNILEFNNPLAIVVRYYDSNTKGKIYKIDKLSDDGSVIYNDRYEWSEKDMFVIKNSIFDEKFPKISDKLKKLLDNIGYFKMRSEYDYLDVADTNNEITYLPKNRIERVPEDERFTSNMRQKVKIGAFFNKAIEDPKGVEYFTNKFKFSYDVFIKNILKIDIVEGEDIRYWYLEDRYVPGGGTLNKSCMRQEDDQMRFDIYCENPDKCKMAIVTYDNKLLGRALLWKLDYPKNIIYMDRIYYQQGYLENYFKKFAREKKMITRDVDGPPSRSKIYVKRDYGDKFRNPYMDSFEYFIRDNGEYFLSNSKYDRNDNIYPDYSNYRNY